MADGQKFDISSVQNRADRYGQQRLAQGAIITCGFVVALACCRATSSLPDTLELPAHHAIALAGLHFPASPLARSAIRIIGTVLLIVLVAYAALCGYMYAFQSSFLYFPTKELVVTPADFGMDYDEVWINRNSSQPLHAWFIPVSDSRGCILYCHGNGGNISYTTDLLGVFHKLGFSTLVFDYAGYGKSEGTPSEDGTYQDAEDAWNYLISEREIPADRILLFGRSLGAAVASRLAATKDPAVLILDSAFTSVIDMGQRLYPILPVKWLSRYEYNTIDTVKDAGCPVIVIHSRDDKLVTYAHGRKVFDAAEEPKTFIEVRGGHNSIVDVDGSHYAKRLETALAELYRSGSSGPGLTTHRPKKRK